MDFKRLLRCCLNWRPSLNLTVPCQTCPTGMTIPVHQHLSIRRLLWMRSFGFQESLKVGGEISQGDSTREMRARKVNDWSSATQSSGLNNGLIEKSSWRAITITNRANRPSPQSLDSWRPVHLYLEEGEGKLKVVEEVESTIAPDQPHLIQPSAGQSLTLRNSRETARNH
jgi:hypothetical protein